jgi:putative hemolysin
MNIAIVLIILIVLILIYGFFETARAAVCELSESELEAAAGEGDKKAAKLFGYLSEEDEFRARIQFCRMCSGTLFSMLSVMFLFYVFNVLLGIGSVILSAFIAFVITLAAVSIFGTMIPKKIGILRSASAANSSVSLLSFFLTITYPFFLLCAAVSGGIIRLFGGNPNAGERVTEEDILSLLEEGEEKGVIDDSQRDMISNIFEFDNITAGDLMTHRTDISAIEFTEGLQETVELAISKGFSRIPVFEEDLDNIVGIIYVKDLLPYVGREIPKSVTTAEFMRSAYMVPESKRCGELFEEMTEKHVQMAIVVDEYGGTAGLITLEDLIESILGNIQDEYDHEPDDIVAQSESSFDIDGTCDIEEVENMLGISLPEGEYDTIGGFLIAQLGNIPQENEHPQVDFENYKFTVKSVVDCRIDRVLAEKIEEEKGEKGEEK